MVDKECHLFYSYSCNFGDVATAQKSLHLGVKVRVLYCILKMSAAALNITQSEGDAIFAAFATMSRCAIDSKEEAPHSNPFSSVFCAQPTQPNPNCTLAMLSRSSRIASHLSARRSAAALLGRTGARNSSNSTSASQVPSTATTALLAATAVAAAVAHQTFSSHHSSTLLESNRIPSSGDVISAGTPSKEPSTGILFPPLCNGYTFAGCGVRVKYGFVKVYAVGTYVDFLSVSPIKSNPLRIEAALLDPSYPRTIRIVMNRNLGIDKYTSAIVEALEPRMQGQDLDKYVATVVPSRRPAETEPNEMFWL